MRNLITRARFLPCLVISVFSISICHAQGTAWVQAEHSRCYFQTSPGSVFTWSGGCKNGYCDGYGTIQWYNNYGSPSEKYIGYLKYGKADGYSTQYYANGNIFYQGYWTNDMKNGYGTYYYSDGTIKYQGNFINDEIENISSCRLLGGAIGELVMNKIFESGENLKTKIVKFINTQATKEIKIEISFDDLNYNDVSYRLTLKLSNRAPYVDVLNPNFFAGLYLVAKPLKLLSDYWSQHESDY